MASNGYGSDHPTIEQNVDVVDVLEELAAFFWEEPTPSEMAEMCRAAAYEDREAARSRRKGVNNERQIA